MLRRRIALVHGAFSGGAGVPGCELAPSALRMAGVASRLRDAGLWVRGLRPELDACGVAGEATRGELNTACQRVRDAIGQTLQAGELPVLLGGDHSLSIGSIAAVADACQQRRRPLWVLWIDAHADFNTPASSPSGNAHGMPAAVVCGHGDAGLLGLGPSVPMVDPARLHLVGVRSVDTDERSLLERSGVGLHGMDLIGRRGLWSVVEPILEKVAAEEGHLHVSLDVDALDPVIAPGVGTPEPDGLGDKEIHDCLHRIRDSGVLGSVDVMEFNPLHDRSGVTARLVIRCLEGLLSGSAATDATDVRFIGGQQ